MKAITIWQPWADLIILGYKGYETRSWATTYTDIIAIHAGKYRKLPHEIYEHISEAIGITPDKYNGSWLHQLEQGIPAQRFGAIIGTAILGKTLRTSQMKEMSHAEKMLGDFTPGRYAWPLKEAKALRDPVPAKGKQGLWNWASSDCYGCFCEKFEHSEICCRCSRYIRPTSQQPIDRYIDAR